MNEGDVVFDAMDTTQDLIGVILSNTPSAPMGNMAFCKIKILWSTGRTTERDYPYGSLGDFNDLIDEHRKSLRKHEDTMRKLRQVIKDEYDKKHQLTFQF